MAGGGIGEAMLISAATGAGTSAITGGDPLKGALMGAALGGAGAAVGGGASAAGGAGAAGSGGAAPISTIPVGETANLAATAGTEAGTNLAAQGLTDPSVLQATGADMGFNVANAPGAGFQLPAGNSFAFDPVTGDQLVTGMEGVAPAGTGTMRTVAQPTYGSMPGASASTAPQTPLQKFYADNPIAVPAGLGALGSVVGAGPDTSLPGQEEYDGPLSQFRYDPRRYRAAASGGLMDTEPARRMAAGGLGSYSDGGQTLKGPGDGMSDSIPASIGDKQPARLADGEFVIPADVVSGLGNGSTDAGARQLYALMDKVRAARTGRTKQAPEINPRKMMPA